jgi:fructosamine-3-kinase
VRLPDAVARGVDAVLAQEGGGDPITDVRGVGGGCINPAARVVTAGGRAFFVKWNDGAPARMFQVEAGGLRALAAPGTLRIPEVMGLGGGGVPGDPGWLLLEFVTAGPPGRDYAERLGRGLALLHREGVMAAAEVPGAGAGASWGWGEDNFIGSLPQANGTCRRWEDFWRERRILPQLEAARDSGFFRGRDGDVLDRLVDAMGPALEAAESDGPSLLHGDLWGGNVYADAEGHPVLIDPAVHRGHREVDLAMSELFGGFPRGFREAYESVWPLQAGYDAVRRPLYQLYYLLVHVNLFGAGYVGRTVSAARSALTGM